MDGIPVVAAVDWGTTRLRTWLLDGYGAGICEHRSDDGLITAQTKGFSAVLEAHLEVLGAPADLPVVICGMAGSRQGWVEAPYVDVPSPIETILRGAIRLPDRHRDIRIVPGLAQRLADAPDVMRGEETQLAGAGLDGSGRHVVCMPGTHSKWVVVEDDSVSGFGTWPTGELFSVLSEHSILRHSLGVEKAVTADAAVFAEACEAMLIEGGDVFSKLFSIRAGSLLSGLTATGAAAKLSGLLIGSEIASATRRFRPIEGPVVLVASGMLASLYRAAFGYAGIAVIQIDADDAVRAGLFQAARQNGMIGEIPRR